MNDKIEINETEAVIEKAEEEIEEKTVDSTENAEAKEEMTTPIPAKRLGQPEEVAEAVAFFANPVNSYVTGQVLCVDGGMAV